jgi:hypothetical protein
MRTLRLMLAMLAREHSRLVTRRVTLLILFMRHHLRQRACEKFVSGNSIAIPFDASVTRRHQNSLRSVICTNLFHDYFAPAGIAYRLRRRLARRINRGLPAR